MEMDTDSFAGRLRVLELYSGIGGMHWALKESGVDFEVVQAMDVNTSANTIYQHNFPGVSVCASSISKLTLNQMQKWSPNTILMSPPCQPFTRVGKKQDCQDPRTESFLHLLDMLRKLEHKPEYILVENVKGFEVSEARNMLVDMLHDCKYTFQEFLLTPLQFGVPNCRMRYYLIAKMKPLEFAFETSEKILDVVPVEAFPWLRYRQSQNTYDCPPSAAEASLASLKDSHQCTGEDPEVKQGLSSSVSHQETKSEACALSKSDHCSEARTKDSGDDCGSKEVSEGVKHSGEKQSDSQCDSEHLLDDCKSKAVILPGEKAEKYQCVNPCGSSVSGDGDGEEPALAGADGGAVTIADAGRNMRHCEEEDMLVCADGTRLEEYLEKADEEYFHKLLLPDKDLRMFVIMDVVHPSFKKSSCFTKRYGHYVEGAGSLVMMTDDVQVVKEASEFKSWAVEQKNREQWGESELAILRRLKLRYFTPREVANLLCFPPEFEFPDGFNTIQCHRVLGNSLNVHVVSILIRLMLMEPGVI